MRLVFATNNEHKLAELRRMAGDKFEIVGLAEIGCHQDIPETGETLLENALQKARFVSERYGVDCFADDSGLEVDALDGAPGVYTARFAALEHGWDSCTPDDNIDLLLERLEGVDNRHARFRTVIALIVGGKEHAFEGAVEGEITHERHGQGGFGYDPVFRPQGWDKTFAEASAEEKDGISHRGRATAALVDYLRANH